MSTVRSVSSDTFSQFDFVILSLYTTNFNSSALTNILNKQFRSCSLSICTGSKVIGQTNNYKHKDNFYRLDAYIRCRLYALLGL